jgi:hypothetical protein
MNKSNIPLQEFIDSYKESLGVEGAEQLITQTAEKQGFAHCTELTKEQALKICRELKKHSGFIGIIGGILHSRIVIR